MLKKKNIDEIPEDLEDAFDYDRYSQRKFVFLLTAVALCVIGFFANLLLSSTYLDSGKLLDAFLFPDRATNVYRIIVWDIKVPEALMAIVAGATFGMAGAVMQTMLNNPLASPYTLGISAGASLGAAIATLAGVSFFISVTYTVSFCAFLFALLACGGIYLIAKRKGFTADVLVLAGIGLVFFFQAVLSFMEYTAPAEALKGIIFWTMGSLSGSNYTEVAVIFVIMLLIFIYVYRHCWDLTTMKLGDSRANSLGVDTSKLRKILFVLISLMTSIAVSFIGCIGFIGIVGPHISRMLLGEDQRYLLPMSCLCGAIILVYADMASKMIITGNVIPVGILTAVIGVPFFFYLLLRKKRKVAA